MDPSRGQCSARSRVVLRSAGVARSRGRLRLRLFATREAAAPLGITRLMRDMILPCAAWRQRHIPAVMREGWWRRLYGPTGISLPTNTGGPDGLPLGEPPGGSSVTA
jgi:hypothetical protein